MNRCDFCNISISKDCEYKNTTPGLCRGWCVIADKIMKKVIEKQRLLEVVEPVEVDNGQ